MRCIRTGATFRKRIIGDTRQDQLSARPHLGHTRPLPQLKASGPGGRY